MASLEAPLGRAIIGEWKNGETRVKLDENVRGSDVFVIQSISNPVDHHLMELLLIIDALRRASADRITAVIPYYGYAKQEKKTSGREPISAKLVANLIVTAGGAPGADARFARSGDRGIFRHPGRSSPRDPAARAALAAGDGGRRCRGR